MHILHVTQEYPPYVGGGSRYVADLAREQVLHGHTVQVLTARLPGVPGHAAGNPEILRVKAPFRTGHGQMTVPAALAFAFNAARRLRLLCRSRRPHVVHAHFAVPGGLAAVLALRRSSTRIVLTFPGADVFDPAAAFPYHRMWPYPAMMRWLVRNCRSACTLSRDMQQRCARMYGCSNVDVVPLGPRREFVEAVASFDRPAPESGEARVLSVGRLVRRKGHDVLLRAVARCRARVSLHLVGGGPEERRLRRLAAELGISGRVAFAGVVPDARLVEAFRCAHIFALATHHEAFGIVFTEAMAAGLPVITTSCGGQTDIVADGETGFLVDVGDDAAMAARIDALCADGALYRAMSAAARARARLFSMERTYAEYLKRYES